MDPVPQCSGPKYEVRLSGERKRCICNGVPQISDSKSITVNVTTPVQVEAVFYNEMLQQIYSFDYAGGKSNTSIPLGSHYDSIVIAQIHTEVNAQLNITWESGNRTGGKQSCGWGIIPLWEIIAVAIVILSVLVAIFTRAKVHKNKK